MSVLTSVTILDKHFKWFSYSNMLLSTYSNESHVLTFLFQNIPRMEYRLLRRKCQILFYGKQKLKKKKMFQFIIS